MATRFIRPERVDLVFIFLCKGYTLFSLQNSEKADKNPEIVLKDCIRVILEEEMSASARESAEADTGDWAANLQSLIDKKSKGKI